MMNPELMMFYNVENFYPPNQKSENTPNFGLRNWDDYKYNLKIKKITNVFRFIEEDFGQLPSVIGLAEIGAKSVLEDLTNANSPIKDYEIVYQPSKDSRGLSVAMLFDKSKFTLTKYQTLEFPMDENVEYDTRDILHAELLSDGKNLHVFILHLPSKRNQNVKKDLRNYILEKLSETLQELFEKGEAVVLMGDFNDNPGNETIKQLCFDKNDNKVMNNPFETFYQENQFSTFHGKKGVCFDQIFYTESALLKNFSFKNIEAEIYNNLRLRNKDSKNNKYPSRTFSGSRYMGGYSDHFPVILKFLNKEPI